MAARKAPPPSCRTHAPPKYARLGATKRSDYAYPKCWMYPIHDASHTRTTAGRYTRFKHNIPIADRPAIEQAIDRAKRRWEIGSRTTSANPTPAIAPHSRENPTEKKKMAKKRRVTKAMRIAGLKNLAKGQRKKGHAAAAKKLAHQAAVLEGRRTKRPKASRKHKKPHKARAAARRPKGRASRAKGRKVTRTATAGRGAARAIATATVTAPKASRRSSRKNPHKGKGSHHHKAKGKHHGGGRRHSGGRYMMHNPTSSSWLNIAILGGSALGGFIIGGIVDRLLATRTPAGGQHPWYGPDAAAHIAARPDAWRLGVGFVGGVATVWLGYFADKKGWHKSGHVLGGVGIGWLIHWGVSIYYAWVAGKAFEVQKGTDETFANRVYPDAQTYLYDNADLITKNDNDAAAKGDPKAADYPPGQMEPLPASYDKALADALAAVKAGTVFNPGLQATPGTAGAPQEQRAPQTQQRETPRFPNMRVRDTVGTPAAEPATAATPSNAPTNKNGHLAGCGCQTCAAPPVNAGPAGDMYNPQAPSTSVREMMRARNRRLASEAA